MLVLVRHGRAVGNAEHRFLGWADAPLDEDGVAQAWVVARRLLAAGVDRIVTSDLRRTVQTAEPLAELSGLPVEHEPRIREIDNGRWTGLLPTDIEAGWPELWASYIGGADVDRPEGERWADVRARVRDVLEELAADGRRTAVFTHGGPVLLAAEWALGMEIPGNIFRGPIAVAANTSVTTIEHGKLVSYADAGHLGEVTELEVPFSPVR